jgi:hypothetical protein
MGRNELAALAVCGDGRGLSGEAEKLGVSDPKRGARASNKDRRDWAKLAMQPDYLHKVLCLCSEAKAALPLMLHRCPI